MTAANADEVAELLGDRADEAIVERIVHLGASLDEVSEALDDLDYQTRFGEPREASSPKIEELRSILEELPYFEDVLAEAAEDEDEAEGLRVMDPEELGREPQ